MRVVVQTDKAGKEAPSPVPKTREETRGERVGSDKLHIERRRKQK